MDGGHRQTLFQECSGSNSGMKEAKKSGNYVVVFCDLPFNDPQLHAPSNPEYIIES